MDTKKITVWQTSAITCLHYYLQFSCCCAFASSCSEFSRQWPLSIDFLVFAIFTDIFLLVLFFLFSLEVFCYLLMASYYFLPNHPMLILAVFSFLLLFLPISYVLICLPCFPPHFSQLSTQKSLIFGHSGVNVIHQKHLEIKTVSPS